MVVRAVGEPDMIRYGLVAGRRIGTAVSRNRAKRRLRQAVLQAGLSPGFDYVLLAGPSALHLPFATLVESIRSGSDPSAEMGASGAFR